MKNDVCSQYGHDYSMARGDGYTKKASSKKDSLFDLLRVYNTLFCHKCGVTLEILVNDRRPKK